ncbi:MAG TPA: hypothetical protein VGB48_03605 [Allosphingosinicella sp.]|jgi:hypothetical protein
MRAITACLLWALPAAAALAQTDLASRIINDPAAPEVNGARAKLVDDAEVQGGKALRVTVPKKGQNNWDSVVETAINKPVKAGDKLVLMLDARLVKGEGDATTATIPYTAVQMKAAPYSAVISGPITISQSWGLYKVEGRAAKDYGAGALKASVQIANAKQIIDFGPIVVLNMGQ